MDIPTLLNQVEKWAQDNANVRSVLLVGSHARGEARPDSDVDLVIVCNDPAELLEDASWIGLFGKAPEYSIEDWGLVQSIRTFYSDGTEIEFGITSLKWAALPVDFGTAEVVAGGASIILDKDGALTSLVDAISRKEDGSAI
jgi:hypothetical protein